MATDAAILEAVTRNHPRSVLDAGCGEGWLVRELESRGHYVTGIDGSAALIAEARSLGGSDFEVCTYDDFVEGLFRPETRFDAIVCNFSLLGEDISPLLKAFHRQLSGRLFVQTLHPLSGGASAYEDGWRMETFAQMEEFEMPMPWYFRTFGSWVSEFERAGLRLVECIEPIHPAERRPLSLLFVCEPRG